MNRSHDGEWGPWLQLSLTIEFCRWRYNRRLTGWRSSLIQFPDPSSFSGCRTAPFKQISTVSERRAVSWSLLAIIAFIFRLDSRHSRTLWPCFLLVFLSLVCGDQFAGTGSLSLAGPNRLETPIINLAILRTISRMFLPFHLQLGSLAMSISCNYVQLVNHSSTTLAALMPLLQEPAWSRFCSFSPVSF